MKTLKTLFALTFLLVSTHVALAVTVGESTISAASAVACTMDVKLCPDGVTYVGRTGPSCAFAECPSVSVVCTDLKYNLKVGSTDSTTNGEVTKLQTFLHPKYLEIEPTGRFVGLTRAAVVSFQKEHNISPAFGYVGALTRAKIKELTCGGISQTLAINSITPSYAKVGETVVLSGPGLNSGRDFILFDGHRIETDGSKVLNRISFAVPEYITNTINCITTPCPLGYSKKVVPGVYTIQVVNNLGTTNTVKLTVVDGSVSPSDTIKISSVEPSAAKVGASVIIYGYNLFRPETRILFDGVSISGKPVYTKRLGDFNSALEFVVPEYLSPQCIRLKPTDPCPLGMVRQVVPGTYELAVDNKYGRDSVKFEVLGDVVGGKPYLSYLNPTQGPVGIEVAIFGQNINTGNEKIYFGGSPVPSTSLVTDRKGVIRFKVPQFITPCGYDDAVLCRMVAQQVTPGKYDVVVKNKEGISNVLTFTVPSGTVVSVPKINSLTPSYGVVGTEVVIKGEGINIGDDKIYFKGGLVSQSYSSSDNVNTLRFKVPSYITSCGVGSTGVCDIVSQPVTPGMYEIVVVNKGGTSNALNFTVTSGSAQAPVATSLSPLSGMVRTSVTVYGSNIDTGSEYVLFDGYRLPLDGAKVAGRVSFIVPSQLMHPCPNPASGLCPPGAVRTVTPGSYTVQVGNVNGVSGSLNFTVTSSTSQAPVISSVNPSSVSVGTQVSISGERLNTGSAKVVLGNGYITPDITRSSDSLLVFTVPSSMPRYCSLSVEMMCTDDMVSVVPGMYDLKVVNSFGASNIKSVTVLTQTSATPAISSISPSSGGTGMQVTLTGSNLNPTSDSVWFGGIKFPPNRTLGSASTLMFTVPQTLFQCDVKPGQECLTVYQPTPLGYYQVKVENSAGQMSNAINYQVTSNASTY